MPRHWITIYAKKQKAKTWPRILAGYPMRFSSPTRPDLRSDGKWNDFRLTALPIIPIPPRRVTIIGRLQKDFQGLYKERRGRPRSCRTLLDPKPKTGFRPSGHAASMAKAEAEAFWSSNEVYIKSYQILIWIDINWYKLIIFDPPPARQMALACVDHVWHARKAWGWIDTDRREFSTKSSPLPTAFKRWACPKWRNICVVNRRYLRGNFLLNQRYHPGLMIPSKLIKQHYARHTQSCGQWKFSPSPPTVQASCRGIGWSTLETRLQNDYQHFASLGIQHVNLMQFHLPQQIHGWKIDGNPKLQRGCFRWILCNPYAIGLFQSASFGWLWTLEQQWIPVGLK